MKPLIRTCSNCHYWDNTSKPLVGTCRAPIPVSLEAWFLRRKPMPEKSGTDCPAHRLRSTRKAAKVEQGVQQ